MKRFAVVVALGLLFAGGALAAASVPRLKAADGRTTSTAASLP